MKRFLVPASLAVTLALFSACETTSQRPPPKKPGGFHHTTPTVTERPAPDPNEEPDRQPKSEKPDKLSVNEPTVNPVPEQPKVVGELQYGKQVPGKPGFVTSPFSPYSGYIDVRGFPPGTEVKDPYSGKSFLVP